MKNIIIRTISGAIYIALIVAGVLYNPHAFSVLLLIFNGIALWEFFQFSKGYKKSWYTISLGTILLLLNSSLAPALINESWAWSVALVPLLLFPWFLFARIQKPVDNISHTVLAFAYITLPLILLDKLNTSTFTTQPFFIVLVFSLVWVNDTFAFLSGLAFGKTKLFERISPKKTWEGFVGGLIITLIAAWFVFPLTGLNSRLVWIVLAGLIAISAVIGDFIESMFKRSFGVKDSGKLIPGHGGILDRIDSILFVFPVVYLFAQLLSKL